MGLPSSIEPSLEPSSALTLPDTLPDVPDVSTWDTLPEVLLAEIVKTVRAKYTDKAAHKVPPSLSLDRSVYNIASLEPYFNDKVPKVGIRDRTKTSDGKKLALGSVKSHNLYLAKDLAIGVVVGSAGST